jgi:hypothetical protein
VRAVLIALGALVLLAAVAEPYARWVPEGSRGRPSGQDVLAWTAGRFVGEPVPGGCRGV